MPEPLEVPWATRLRPLSSAEVTTRRLDDGRLQMRVVHAPLRRLTREMFLWWMNHVDQQIEWNGRRVLAYRLWHPLDHIHFAMEGRRSDGTVGPGTRWHISEAFQRQPKWRLDGTFTVARIDEHGFQMELLKGPFVLGTSEEQWEDVPGGARWIVTATFGPTGALLAPVRRLALWHMGEMLSQWPRHNVEEGGTFEHFLEELFVRETRRS